MTSVFRFAPAVLAAFALLAGLFSAASAWLEAQPYRGGGTAAEAANRLLDGIEAPGLSWQSYQLVLGDCLNTMASVYGRTRPTPERSQLAARCRAIAEAGVRDMPAFSFGWYALAAVAMSQGDVKASNAALRISQQTGPNEQWIAEQRVVLAESHFSGFEAASGPGHTADLLLLAQSERGVAAIAQLYVDNRDFRERMTAIVETLPPETQQKFIDNVKAAGGLM